MSGALRVFAFYSGNILLVLWIVGCSPEASLTADHQESSSQNLASTAAQGADKNPLSVDLELKQRFVSLSQQLSSASDEATRLELQAQIQKLRQELVRNRQQRLEQQEATLSPAEKARREQERLEEQQFMASLQNLPVEERREAFLRRRLSQQGLNPEQITAQIAKMQSQTQTVDSQRQAAQRQMVADLRKFMEQHRDADPETRRQAIIKWMQQNRT